MTLTLAPGKVFRWLIMGACSLTALSVVDHCLMQSDITIPHILGSILHRFQLDREASIPTWYSSALLAFSALLVSISALAHGRQRSPDVRYWKGLALMFLACSIEEVAALHEGIHLPFDNTLSGFLHFAWVLPGFGLVLAVTGTYAKFVYRLPHPTRLLLVLAGALYFGGALGMEMLEGRYIELYTEDFLASLLSDLEEFLEMLGASLFAYAWMRYLQVTATTVALGWDDSASHALELPPLEPASSIPTISISHSTDSAVDSAFPYHTQSHERTL